MVSESVENLREERFCQYSVQSPFPCIVFLKGKKYSECCCKLQAKDQLFALVHLIGFNREDVKVIDFETKEEMFL